MPRNFPGWRRGDPADAERLNRQHKARNQGIIGGRGIDVVRGHDGVVIQLKETRIIPSGGGDTGAPGGHKEVVIMGTFETWPECQADSDCALAFDNDSSLFVPHLGCHDVLADGTVDIASYVPVLPNWGHTVAEFRDVAWAPSDPNRPTFSAFASARGWTMSFGQGERWVDPPTDVCGPDDPDPGEEGACCQLGDCTDTTLAECLKLTDGVYKGNGTSCADVPDPCAIGGGGTGACCSLDGQLCNVIEESACAGIGIYQGDDTVCDPWPCGPISGACCIDGVCVLQADEEACGFSGGLWLGGPCVPDPCGPAPSGRCCHAGGCDVTTEAHCVKNLGGSWAEGGECSPPTVCDFGACCRTTGTCYDTTDPDNCEAQHGPGAWQGQGSSCASNPCPPAGFCCWKGSCHGWTESFCASQGGVWCDSECPAPCGPNPCP